MTRSSRSSFMPGVSARRARRSANAQRRSPSDSKHFSEEPRIMKIAIVGVTGAVGETILRVLDERSDPGRRTRCVRVARSARSVRSGETVAWPIVCGHSGRSYATAPSMRCSSPRVTDASAELGRSTRSPAARSSSITRRLFVCTTGVPLVIPEVNPYAVLDHRPHLSGRKLHGDRPSASRSPRSPAWQASAAFALRPIKPSAAPGRAGLDALEREEKAAYSASARTSTRHRSSVRSFRNVIPAGRLDRRIRRQR